MSCCPIASKLGGLILWATERGFYGSLAWGYFPGRCAMGGISIFIFRWSSMVFLEPCVRGSFVTPRIWYALALVDAWSPWVWGLTDFYVFCSSPPYFEQQDWRGRVLKRVVPIGVGCTVSAFASSPRWWLSEGGGPAPRWLRLLGSPSSGLSTFSDHGTSYGRGRFPLHTRCCCRPPVGVSHLFYVGNFLCMAWAN